MRETIAELAESSNPASQLRHNYVADIERRCCQLSPEERMEVFIRGLLPDFRSYVIKSHPKTVDEAITLAMLAQSTSVKSSPISAIKELVSPLPNLPPPPPGPHQADPESWLLRRPKATTVPPTTETVCSERTAARSASARPATNATDDDDCLVAWKARV